MKEIEPEPVKEGLEAVQAVELIETLIDSRRLDATIGRDEEFKPLIISGDHLYLQKMLYLENRFVEVLRHRLDVEIYDWDEAKVERALRDVCSAHVAQGTRPDIERRTSIGCTCGNALSDDEHSGGPGSGKTTIVLSILHVARLGVSCEEIALAAPTGKAANRMGEAIDTGLAEIVDPTPEDLDLANLELCTLHRLLGYSQRTGRFLYHENNRLAERVVVVDEGSMIDLALMERLVRSLRNGSRFVLLGDAHQLPSVEAGDVLRDLLAASEGNIGALRVPVGVQLLESHRMREEDENGEKYPGCRPSHRQRTQTDNQAEQDER